MIGTLAQSQAPGPGGGSLVDHDIVWPTAQEVLRVLRLQDYNTRVVLLGTLLLGLAAGIVGTFMLLRKRSLVGDALSHATLPGICAAFMIMAAMGGTGKSLPGLLLGATVSSLLGMGFVLAVRHLTRLKEDAALGIVLSVFFGLGIALLGIIQKMSTGNAAGLQSFIYGKTASMLASDAWLIAVAALLVTAVSVMLLKEFTLVCFDAGYAGAQGWPVLLLDGVMMALVIGVTVIGLQAVGLILVIALLVIPPAAARFWTHHLPSMVAVSAAIGGVSGLVGAALSALVPKLPAGAVIVLVAGAAFLVSMICGRARGLLVRALEASQLNRAVGQQNLLRAFYESVEAGWSDGPLDAHAASRSVSWEDLLRARSWTPAQLRRLLRGAERAGLVERSGEEYRLTMLGLNEAQRVVRNHRLWEVFLITHADIAPTQVDRAADRIEHVLGQAMVDKLEAIVRGQAAEPARGERAVRVPVNPHTARG